jgi:hypothetical protein
LNALRQLCRELVWSWSEAHHNTEKNEYSNPNGDVQATQPEKKPLHIPTGAPDFLFQRGQLNPLLDGCQAFPMDHHSARMLHPLAESHVTSQNPYESNEFHRSFSFPLFILAGKAAGCATHKNFCATQTGAQEY